MGKVFFERKRGNGLGAAAMLAQKARAELDALRPAVPAVRVVHYPRGATSPPASAEAMAGRRPSPPSDGGEGEPPVPSLGRRIVNVVKAAATIATGWMEDGRVLEGKAGEEARKAICLACAWYRRSDDICAHPGCGCPIERKARYLRSSCPLKKWKVGVGM